jgi:hypothetical protein
VRPSNLVSLSLSRSVDSLVAPSRSNAPIGYQDVATNRPIVGSGESARIVSVPGDRFFHKERLDEARLLLRMAREFRAGERPDHTRRFARRALAILERVWGSNHPEVVLALLCVAAAREDLADYQRAEGEYRRAHRILDRIAGDFDDFEVLTLRIQTIRGVASVARALGRHSESEAALKYGLTLARQTSRFSTDASARIIESSRSPATRRANILDWAGNQRP